MCVITAIFAFNDDAQRVDRNELLRIRERMVTRGPDGAGEWFSGDMAAGLGHRPPSIIDLTETGAQRTATPDERPKSLDNVGGRMIGVIVNKYSQIGHYGYYKYYRYYHYQSSYYQQRAGAQVLTSGDDHGEKPVGRDDG